MPRQNASWLARPRSCRRRSGRRTGSCRSACRGLPRPERAILIADASASIALSWPNTTFFRSRSSVCSLLRSSVDTFCGGMRAILATISSTSVLPIVFFCLRLRQDALRRAGLVDHVDRLVGQVPVVDEARRQLGRRRQRRGRVLDAVVLLEARLQALQDLDRLVRRSARPRRPSGSAATARGPSRRCRGTRCTSSRRCTSAAPVDSAGLSRFDASSVPPEAAPAPMSVWISSMNRIAFGLSVSCLSTRLQALLEIAAVLGAGQQRAHVERVDTGIRAAARARRLR